MPLNPLILLEVLQNKEIKEALTKPYMIRYLSQYSKTYSKMSVVVIIFWLAWKLDQNSSKIRVDNQDDKNNLPNSKISFSKKLRKRVWSIIKNRKFIIIGLISGCTVYLIGDLILLIPIRKIITRAMPQIPQNWSNLEEMKTGLDPDLYGFCIQLDYIEELLNIMVNDSLTLDEQYKQIGYVLKRRIKLKSKKDVESFIACMLWLLGFLTIPYFGIYKHYLVHYYMLLLQLVEAFEKKGFSAYEIKTIVGKLVKRGYSVDKKLIDAVIINN